MEKPNSTMLWLVAGFGALLLLVLFFAGRQGDNEDRLGDSATTNVPETAQSAKGCSGGAVAAGLKRALFAQALEIRGKDVEAYQQIENQAVIRMENEALEEELADGLACTASVAIDLPPGIVANGGQRNMMSDVDYLVATNGSGVALRNAPALVNSLATLSRSTGAIISPLDAGNSDAEATQNDSDAEDAASVTEPAPPPRIAQPSFDCSKARTPSEQAVCANPALAALDRQMAAAYNQAMSGATPGRQALLRQTRDHFLGYRDRCPSDRCIANAYEGRIREIDDIATGRWQLPR